MARVDLNVPFAEKDQAKSLGARWDSLAKVWYVPSGVNAELFACWLPSANGSDPEHEPEFGIRSPHYFVLESATDCWKCSRLTRVFSFMLPEQHEQFEYAQDDDEDFALTSNPGYWVCHG